MKPEPIANCDQCGRPFMRRSTMHRVCSPRCAVKDIKAAKAAERADTKRRKDAAKPRSQWIREAQAAVNAWVRIRDAHLPCVSCGRMHGGQWHAGHFVSTGARPELRFDEANVHRQCQPCNTHLHGNLVLYRAELIRRVGLDEVERLEGPTTPRKYTVAELRAIRDDYRARVKGDEWRRVKEPNVRAKPGAVGDSA